MSGILYILSTPIGNLSDMSSRACKTLTEVDFIAAEDTRVTVKLLNHLEIKKPLISYHQHNEQSGSRYILQRILQGESCALCSDAGTPAISDPGEVIVQNAIEQGIKVVPIPGISAAITALSCSGLPSGRFCFEGFLSVSKKARKQHLHSIKDEKRTLIFYEAPHKLAKTLCDLYETLGNRKITLARELTKIHEEFIYTTLQASLELYKENVPRGEFVIVVEGKEDVNIEFTLQDAVSAALEYLADGASINSAAKTAAAEFSFSKSEIYKLLLLGER